MTVYKVLRQPCNFVKAFCSNDCWNEWRFAFPERATLWKIIDANEEMNVTNGTFPQVGLNCNTSRISKCINRKACRAACWVAHIEEYGNLESQYDSKMKRELAIRVTSVTFWQRHRRLTFWNKVGLGLHLFHHSYDTWSCQRCDEKSLKFLNNIEGPSSWWQSLQ